jgi:hypothetical protein
MARTTSWLETETAVVDAPAKIKSAVEFEELDEQLHDKLSLRDAL